MRYGFALVSRSYRGHVSIAAPCLSALAALALTRLAQRHLSCRDRSARRRSHELLPKYFKQPKYDEKQAEAEDKPD